MAARSGSSWWRKAVLVVCLAVLCASAGNRQRLSIRPGTGFRCQVPQGEGEAQLMALSRSSGVEDAWLSVGDAWIDAGHDEEPDHVLIDLQLMVVAARERHPADRLAFYHLHPFHEDPRTIEPPSCQDIHSLALMKSTCGVEMTGIIFDGRGRWTFDITADLADRLLHEERTPDDYAANHGYTDRPASAARFDRDYPLIAWSASVSTAATREECIRAFIDSARLLGVIVTYVPR